MTFAGSISLISFALGMICTASAFMVNLADCQWKLWAYVGLLGMFHFLEFFWIGWSSTNVSLDDFLLNHSRSYHLSLLASLTEYFCGHDMYPLEFRRISTVIGLGLAIGGQFMRSWAMAWLGSSFSHVIDETLPPQLVTTGPYRLMRHPSYLGFFVWCLGCQLVLVNGACFAVFSMILWNFFSRRIAYEESVLERRFGVQFTDYKSRTWSGIPFVE